MDRMVSMHQQELPVQIDEYIQSHYTERIDAVSIAQHFHIGKTKIYEIDPAELWNGHRGIYPETAD